MSCLPEYMVENEALDSPPALVPGATMRMGPGDYVHIPAHRRHRVAWTDPAQATVWLAVHYDDVGRQAG